MVLLPTVLQLSVFLSWVGGLEIGIVKFLVLAAYVDFRRVSRGIFATVKNKFIRQCARPPNTDKQKGVERATLESNKRKLLEDKPPLADSALECSDVYDAVENGYKV
ncbi:hypothetical protein NPIL_543021 [Nephila pilipes]|uniref:Uncharacterized protein n=1 Tax=Nephila pilipes TaxID=299642 RepID=A0A8X6QQI6_NEPPI|nr:hypothetical protein NPIL_543021 [Nephila pilipes]